MSGMLRVNLPQLDALFDDLSDRVDASTRPAAQAMAQVIYDEVKRNVAALGRKTGNLDRSIYQAFSQDNSSPTSATYHVSYNHAKAPHGSLVEFGHIQRYASYIGKDGNWYTVKRPESEGKPKPSRGASQAAKDAYYLLRPGGPQQQAAHPFIRPATSKFPQAIEAAEKKIYEVLNER